MHITYYDLNQYVVVSSETVLKPISNVDEILCVPFNWDLSFLNKELKPFKKYDTTSRIGIFLVKDTESHNFNILDNKWNKYVLFGLNYFEEDTEIHENSIIYHDPDGFEWTRKHIRLTEEDVKNNILIGTNWISIYNVMYGINKIANLYYKPKNNHGLEKAGTPAKEASRIIQDKVKDTKGKAKLHLIPQQILYDIAEVREYGNIKYPTGGEDNWKLGDPKDYLDAAYRHLTKMVRDGMDSKDEESGIEHYKHFATNAAFICGFMGGEHEDVSRDVEQ